MGRACSAIIEAVPQVVIEPKRESLEGFGGSVVSSLA
jgi:hypothetical protein